MEYSSKKFKVIQDVIGHYTIVDKSKNRDDIYLQSEFDINEMSKQLEGYKKNKKDESIKIKNKAVFLKELFDSYLSEYFN